MGERDFAGREPRTAANHGGIRRRVVRRSKGRLPEELPDRAVPGNRCDDRGRQCRGVVERREETGDRSGQQGLAGARRADEEEAVTARQGDFESPPCLGLAADLRQIGDHGRGAAR